MTAEIKVLPNPEREQCKADVIKLLEEVLDQAKKGEIISVAIASVSADLGSRTVWSQNDNTVVLLGSAAVLHARLCKSLMID